MRRLVFLLGFVACTPPPVELKPPNEAQICERAEACELWPAESFARCMSCVAEFSRQNPDLPLDRLPDLLEVECNVLGYLAKDTMILGCVDTLTKLEVDEIPEWMLPK
jgi:hypothetical protein